MREIKAELETVIAVADLDDEAGEHHHEDEQDLDQHECEELAAEQNPAANRKCVHDLRDAGIAFPPNQFAGVEGDDGENEERRSHRRPVPACAM